MHRRVVITGIGFVTPLGDRLESTMNRLAAGDCAIGPITRFDTTGFPPHTAAEIPDFDPSAYGISGADQEILDVWVHFSLAASELAVQDSGLNLPRNEIASRARADAQFLRYGVSFGSAYLSGEYLSQQILRLYESGPAAVDRRLLTKTLPNAATTAISIRYGLCGPMMTVSAASASGTDCLIAAIDKIRMGKADVMIAGGAEAGVSALTVTGLSNLRAMSRTGSCRPFDTSRDGMVISEGSCVLVLEDLEHAVARGARIHGEILGYGQRGDGYHLNSIPAEAPSHIDCLNEALTDAQVTADRIGYVNIHGTGTVQNDRAEAHAIHAVFGDGQSAPWVSATKGATGHMGGGSGPFETVVSLWTILAGQVPPTVGLRDPSPDCRVNHVIGKAIDAPIEYAMTLSNGMGGNSSALVIAGPPQ